MPETPTPACERPVSTGDACGSTALFLAQRARGGSVSRRGDGQLSCGRCLSGTVLVLGLDGGDGDSPVPVLVTPLGAMDPQEREAVLAGLAARA